MKLAIQDIDVDPTIQIRQGNREETVQRYEESFDNLPPIDVFDTPDGLLLADGFHRWAAAMRLGRTEIEANVRKGTREDAAEHAVIANTKNAVALTAEERDAGIRRLKLLHDDWSHRDIAKAMSVNRRTVGAVFQVAEVREAVTGGARAPHVSDSHLREIAAADPEDWQPLAKAAGKREWTRDETRLAAQNLKNPRVSKEHKQAIRSGEADPYAVDDKGEFAIPVDRIGRKIREMKESDELLAMEQALAALARARAFEPGAIVGSMQPTRRRHFIEEMPGYISFMEEVLNAAKNRKLEAIT